MGSLWPLWEGTAELLLEDGLLLRALDKIEIIKTNQESPCDIANVTVFLACPRGRLFLFYNHRMRKVTQGVRRVTLWR